MVGAVAEEKKDEESVQRSLELGLNHGGGGRRGSSKGASRSSSGGNAAPARRSSSLRKAKEDALAHLVRYETMVRQQEAEDMATLAYMRPCLERLVQLAEVEDEEPRPPPTAARMDRTFSFRSLRVAREKLDAIERDPGRQGEEKEFLATDRQLLMVLRILTKDDEERSDEATTLTWAEFVQCYKVCIAGMLTLQQLAAATAAPKGSQAESDAYSDSLSLASLRSRTRDRTISMMTLFGPSSTRMLNAAKASSRRTATKSSAATRIVWLALKAALALLVVAAATIGASWTYHWTRHNTAAMRGRDKPPRFVPLTLLYPPHFYNTSPMTASTRTGGGGDVAPASIPSPGYHHAAFPSRTPPPLHPRGVVPVSRTAARFFSAHDRQPPPLQSAGAVAARNIDFPRHELSVWQHAIGGAVAVALPLTAQLLFPPAVAGRFVATASLLMVAAAGAATNVLASLCARALVRLRQWWLTASTTSPPASAST